MDGEFSRNNLVEIVFEGKDDICVPICTLVIVALLTYYCRLLVGAAKACLEYRKDDGFGWQKPS